MQKLKLWKLFRCLQHFQITSNFVSILIKRNTEYHLTFYSHFTFTSESANLCIKFKFFMFKIRISFPCSSHPQIVNYISRWTKRNTKNCLIQYIFPSRELLFQDNKFILPSNKGIPLLCYEGGKEDGMNLYGKEEKQKNMADNKKPVQGEISDATHWCLWSVSSIFLVSFLATAAAAATALLLIIHRCNPIIINLISNFFFLLVLHPWLWLQQQRGRKKIAGRDNKRVFSILFLV